MSSAAEWICQRFTFNTCLCRSCRTLKSAKSMTLMVKQARAYGVADQLLGVVRMWVYRILAKLRCECSQLSCDLSTHLFYSAWDSMELAEFIHTQFILIHFSYIFSHHFHTFSALLPVFFATLVRAGRCWWRCRRGSFLDLSSCSETKCIHISIYLYININT